MWNITEDTNNSKKKQQTPALLDSPDFIHGIDRSNMLADLGRFALQCRDAWRLGSDAVLPPPRNFCNVLLLGMGGSAIGGDLTKLYAQVRCRLPVEVVKTYEVPSWVSARTLVIAVSHSGNTEETISAYLQCKNRKATCVVVTGGGKLASLACPQEDGVIIVPQTMQPRNSMAYLTLPLLLVLEGYGLLELPQQELVNILEAVNGLEAQANPCVLQACNPAKQLAAALYQCLPVIWGVSGNTEAMAYRWKSQLNENAKTAAYFNVLPELNHNEIMGVQNLPQVQQQTAVIILRSQADSIRLQNRIAVTKELWQGKVGKLIEVWAVGKSALAKLFYFILLGDYVSTYLACLYETDPAEISLIHQLKARLQQETPVALR